VLNCLSRKAYTIGMVNHARVPCVMDPAAHQWTTSLYKISDLNRAPELWLAAHLECAKEGVNVYTADRVRYLKRD
jgi:hypothetical protein